MTGARLTCQIAVLTFRRPEDLTEILPLVLDQAEDTEHHVEVVVIDNDPAAGARYQVGAFASRSVLYRHEPTPGIAAARNTALDNAADCDVIVFIDDDERPVAGWLDALLELYVLRRPAAVVGPVVSRFTMELDPWLRDGAFFSRRRHPTGSLLSAAATNNLLLDMSTVNRLHLRFEPSLGLSGGSDTYFTRQLAAAGETMLWNDEAVVIDVVPAHRQTREWVLQRAFRSGNSWSRTSLLLKHTLSARTVTRVRLMLSGIARVGAGSLNIAGGKLLRSSVRDARGHRTLRRGLGMLSGALGGSYHEYTRANGN